MIRHPMSARIRQWSCIQRVLESDNEEVSKECKKQESDIEEVSREC